MGCIQAEGMSAGKGMQGIEQQHEICQNNKLTLVSSCCNSLFCLTLLFLKAIYVANAESFEFTLSS